MQSGGKVWSDRTTAAGAAPPPAGGIPLDAALAPGARLILLGNADLSQLLGIAPLSRYDIVTEAGQPVGSAIEAAGSGGDFLGRQFWRAAHPFLIHVVSDNRIAFSIVRPLDWRHVVFPLAGLAPAWVLDGAGNQLARIQPRFSLLRRRLTIYSADDVAIADIRGPVFRPWTFEVRRHPGGPVIALIQKKWAGLAREFMIHANRFAVTLPHEGGPRTARVLLGAALLIEFCYFGEAGITVSVSVNGIGLGTSGPVGLAQGLRGLMDRGRGPGPRPPDPR
jgi:hypothetical protein